MKAPKALTDLLRRHEPGVQSTTVAMRAVVLDEIGGCYETILQVYRSHVISILYSTTEKKLKDNICAVVVYRDHVNLMFTRGVDLTDPNGLLEGSGKAMRHIKMRTAADVDRPGVRALIRQAQARPDLGTPKRPLKRVVTEMKAPRPQPRRKPTTLPRLF